MSTKCDQIKKVLLVEDDEFLGSSLREGLRHHGYEVVWIKDGRAASDITELNEERFCVVILDIGLPQISGLSVLTLMRQRNNMTPVIILSANDTSNDRVSALDAGADVYISKPFDLEELCAYIRALMRRVSVSTENNIQDASAIQIGELMIHNQSRTITYKQKPVSLSRREFDLLKMLAENAGRVMTRNAINLHLYRFSENIDSNALEVHIHNLRKLFDDQLIRTVRGVGYTIDRADRRNG